MRQAFINTLIQLAEQDKNIYLLTADMGFGVMEQFATRFPKRYINVGVAEQNMIGVAAGLALEGKKVFCYSIANFPTLRCLEQIRNDVCYHNLPVCIVSGGAGLWYGALGMTHHAVEDIAMMRCLPNMSIVSPYNPDKMIECVNDVYKQGKPCYLRVTRTSNRPVEPQHVDAHNGSSRALILVTGGRLAENASGAADQLIRNNIGVDVLVVTKVRPLYNEAIIRVAKKYEVIITVEEHSRIGGLGSTVAETLAERKRPHPPLVRLGTKDEYPTTAMSYDELLEFHHLDTKSITDAVYWGLIRA